MALNTLETAYVNGQIIDASHVNEITLALVGQFVGRDANGVPTPGQSLGTLAIPWGNLYANGIILNGSALDPDQITNDPNRVVSGQSRPLSSLSDFIRPNGSALEYTIEGSTTDLVLVVNNTTATITTDLTVSGITAAPSSNNTADINDTSISNSLFAGEDGTDLIIDAAGSEITSRIGQTAAFRTPTGEIFTALIKSATLLTNVFRGFYFDSSGNPIQRGNLSNNDTITLMNIGWVFVEDNGTTVDTSYQTPVYSYEAPSSPVAGQYWFDITNQVWKRYSGTSFEIINRILVGQVVSDATNTVASKSSDFSKNFEYLNNIIIERDSSEIIKSTNKSTRCSVYGAELKVDLTKLEWNITTDLESGLSESPDTEYFLYLSDQAQVVISDKKPHDRFDLKGYYHPYESWLCVGQFYNDSSDDITMNSFVPYNTEIHEQEVLILDEKPDSTQGGTYTAGSFITRILTEKYQDTEMVDLVTNQIRTLSGLHRWDFNIPARGVVNGHKAIIRNIDDSTDQIIGTSTQVGAADDWVNSIVKGETNFLVPKLYEAQSRCQTTNGSVTALGTALGFGMPEIYSNGTIKRIRRRR